MHFYSILFSFFSNLLFSLIFYFFYAERIMNLCFVHNDYTRGDSKRKARRREKLKNAIKTSGIDGARQTPMKGDKTGHSD